MTITEPGTITICGDDSLRIEAGGTRFFITKEDVKSLIFNGRVVPISKSVCRTGTGGISESCVSIEGHSAIGPGGKAVKFFTTKGHFILPFISLQRVARGEAVSAPLFPLEPDSPEGQR
ncbi:MAG: hypothetical protein JW931_00010 [Methanomicrobiaceae archaeon]|nr:hypothetical protein [Methanomicrobiaceae archaeon]